MDLIENKIKSLDTIKKKGDKVKEVKIIKNLINDEKNKINDIINNIDNIPEYDIELDDLDSIIEQINEENDISKKIENYKKICYLINSMQKELFDS